MGAGRAEDHILSFGPLTRFAPENIDQLSVKINRALPDSAFTFPTLQETCILVRTVSWELQLSGRCLWAVQP